MGSPTVEPPAATTLTTPPGPSGVARLEVDNNAEEAVRRGEWVDCWICSTVFCRRRQTTFFCYDCGSGFCIGEHGVFHDVGRCILCMDPK
jgi:hypothetical protein